MRAGITFRNASKADPYLAAVRAAGLEPVTLTPASRVDLDSIDGLLLTGGSDVDPARYGEERTIGCEAPDGERDEFEIRLVELALADRLPILAICRGIQLLNVALGGTLIQDLPTTALHRVRNPDDPPGRHAVAHTIRVAPGTRLASIVGAGEFAVNSRHHQAVKRVAPSLMVSAVAPDGVIEAVEMPGDDFVVAVQWHPEDRVHVSEGDRKLFEAFAQAIERESWSAASS
jgi:putative glutamine amidotransferase